PRARPSHPTPAAMDQPPVRRHARRLWCRGNREPPVSSKDGGMCREYVIMMAEDPIQVVPYDPAWPAMFRRQAADLREALGAVALRIDHIGSTAIPQLAAKPVIDIQISVAD